MPHLFESLTLRDVTLQNPIAVSPSSSIGVAVSRGDDVSIWPIREVLPGCRSRRLGSPRYGDKRQVRQRASHTGLKLITLLVLIAVLSLVQGCASLAQRNEQSAKNHEGEATTLAKEAIEHAKAGEREAFGQKAQLALEAAEMAQQEQPHSYLEQAITRLKMGMEYGKREQVDKGQKQLSKALQQIETRVADANPNDRQLGPIVVGRDRGADVQHKLGNAPCVVPSAHKTTISYLYNVGGHAYLRLELEDTVEALTLSEDPPLTEVCYAPVLGPISFCTGKGLQLGATANKVIRVYGQPSQTLRVGPLTRFRYEAMLDRPYEWDVVFRDDRLIEWTVAVSA